MRRRILALALSAGAAAGCAAPGSGPGPLAGGPLERLTGRSVALVADGCVFRNEPGHPEFVLRQASLETGRGIASAAAHHLREAGFSVGAVETPFACGALHGPRAIAETPGEERAEGLLPIAGPGRAAEDPVLAGAFHALLRRVAAATAGDAAPAADIGLSSGERGMLRAALGATDVWIVAAGGTDAEGAGEHGYLLALADLEAGTLAWKQVVSGQRGSPIRAGRFTAQWAADAFGAVAAAPPPPSFAPPGRARLNPSLPAEPGRAVTTRIAATPDEQTPVTISAAAAADSPGITIAEADAPPAADAPQDEEGESRPEIETTVLSAATGAPVPFGSMTATPAEPPAPGAGPAPGLSALPPLVPVVPAPPATGPAPALPAQARLLPMRGPFWRTATGRMALRARPTPDSPAVAEVEDGTVLEVQRELENASGRWWYARAGGREGWLREF